MRTHLDSLKPSVIGHEMVGENYGIFLGLRERERDMLTETLGDPEEVAHAW